MSKKGEYAWLADPKGTLEFACTSSNCDSAPAVLLQMQKKRGTFGFTYNALCAKHSSKRYREKMDV